jgi:hypothetical protein
VKRPTLAWCTGLALFVAATNRYADPVRDYALYHDGMGDAFSYMAIAEAASGMPTMAMPFHHAQRIAVPYLIGLVHDVIPLPLHWLFLMTVAALAVGILFLIAQTLEDLSLEPGQAGLILAALALNPWVFRSYIAYPEMVNDLGFVFGLSVLLRGLVQRSVWLVIVGQLVASASRQTGLLLVPMVVLWLWGDRQLWGQIRRRRRVVVACAVASIAVIAYLVTARIAGGFAATNKNLDHVLAGYQWMRTQFDARALIKFLLMAAESPFVTACLILAFVGRRNEESSSLVSILVFGSLCIWTQPLLAGPGLTGGSIQRLMTVGLLPLLLAAAVAVRDAKAFGDLAAAARSRWVVGLLGIASLHQAYVSEWFPMVGHHTIHMALYSAATIAAVSVIAAERASLNRARVAVI